MANKPKPKERDMVLEEKDEIESVVFVLENQFTKYRLYDARVNLAVIKAIEKYKAAGYTYPDAVLHFKGTVSDSALVDLFSKILSAPRAAVDALELAATKIVSDFS